MNNEISANSSEPNETKLEEYAKDLLETIKITKGIRYLSASRLEKKDRVASLLVAILSIIVIISTLIEWILRTHNILTDWVFLLTTSAPIFILVISQYESAKKYLVHSQRMFRSAQDLEKLQRRVKFSLAKCNLDKLELELFSSKYGQILRETAVNHESVDNDFFKACNPISHPTRYNADTCWDWIYIRLKGKLHYLYNVFFWPFIIFLLHGLILAKLIYVFMLQVP